MSRQTLGFTVRYVEEYVDSAYPIVSADVEPVRIVESRHVVARLIGVVGSFVPRQVRQRGHDFRKTVAAVQLKATWNRFCNRMNIRLECTCI